MTQKQLANVLTKMVGVSMLPQAFMHMVTGFLDVLNYWSATAKGGFNPGFSVTLVWSNFTSGLILAVLGVVIIRKSRKVVELIFKGEAGGGEL